MDEKKLKALAAELAKGLKTEADLNQFSRMLTKLTVETALNAELTDHLGHEKNAPKSGSNTRNGYSSKTVLCDDGEIELNTPRDRENTFEPQLIKKHQTRITLMDMMTDNEVEAVIGHEMGHVALGHVKKGMQVALGTNAVRAAAASAGGIVGSLSQSQLGDLGEKLVNSQFSQRQESEADDYSYDLLRKRGINPAGLATSFEKLAKLEAGRQSSMFDDHPASAERAQHIRDRMSADGIK